MKKVLLTVLLLAGLGAASLALSREANSCGGGACPACCSNCPTPECRI